MKVMLINGSPHEKGCTYTALMECAKTLNEGGIETEVFWIGKKPVQGCVACGGCARLGRCAFNDPVNGFIEKAQTADGFIFGSPVYFSGMNGGLMSFMDRAFFAGPRHPAGNPFAYKPAAAVVSARRAGTTSALDQMNKYFLHGQLPVISSRYWNMVHGNTPEEVMGLTWDQCRTWYFGTKRVTVHLTPSDEQTYRFLRDELRAKHRSEYRERRCMIPGKLKPLIPCPEKNSCKNCPYPQCRDSQLPDLSWDEYVDVMSGVAQVDPGFAQLERRMAIADAVKFIADQNPKFAQAIVLKEYYGLTVTEIAQKLNDTERNIYYFLDQAKKIGKQYKRDNE